LAAPPPPPVEDVDDCPGVVSGGFAGGFGDSGGFSGGFGCCTDVPGVDVVDP
jgi:hypothetical protein